MAEVDMILRQTDYSIETATQKLKDHNNDVMAVIREYMAPVLAPASAMFVPTDAAADKDLKKGTTVSVNQQIYKEIRIMMDAAAKTYEMKKQNENK